MTPGGSTARSQVEVYSHPDQIPLDARRLFDQAEALRVGFGLAWYRNLIEAVFRDHGGVRFFVLRHDGHPVAAIPALIDHGFLGQRISSLGNYYTTLYSPVITPGLDATDLLPLIVALRDADDRSASLTFAPLDPDSEVFGLLLAALGAAGLRPFRFFCFGNWYLSSAGLSWRNYLASRTGGLRSTIKRMSTKFAADGGSLEIVSGAGHLDEATAMFQRVYAASWKKAEPFPGFVPGLIDTCVKNGWLRLGIARLKEQAIAAQLWIVANERAEIYKVAYDEAYKQYSPGTLLTAHLLQHVIEQDRVSEVDFLVGDDRYKQSWMSHRRERWGLVAYNVKTFGGLLGLARELAGRRAKPWWLRIKALVESRQRRNP